MAKSFTTMAGAALLLACGAASAQLGNGGGTYAGVDKVNLNPPAIVASHLDNAQLVLNADAKLLGAVGMNDAAAQAAAAGTLTADATRAQIEEALKVQSDSGHALEQKLAAKAELNDTAKLAFSSAVGDLARGLTAEAGMARDLAEVRKTLKPGGGAAASAIYLSKALPGSVKDLGETLRAAAAYAKANNIMLPQAATEALNQL
ncbi:hypothetical protein GJ697_12940 [Pseudoduganella sp. FT25W]|uniref:DUF4142 domain-containing protein n=1 Tax=Duganella alba TaxID=2666081 RepID=A0A6L5QG51_9BURK|nr:hypothetical protein [Duganella alba]MRX08747.1 hypothetical protein [Duganella alba]MRX18765.1 hypothetical protein [Duganella alba]